MSPIDPNTHYVVKIEVTKVTKVLTKPIGAQGGSTEREVAQLSNFAAHKETLSGALRFANAHIALLQTHLGENGPGNGTGDITLEDNVPQRPR